MQDDIKLASIKGSVRLVHAVEDAMYLVEHASLTGVILDDAILKPILTVKAIVLKNDGEEPIKVDTDLESGFWEAMGKLTQKFPEVSALSLKSIKKKKEENFGVLRRVWRSLFNFKSIPRRPAVSDAKRVASLYRYGAVVWLAVLIIGQIYWIIGKDLFNECKRQLPHVIARLDNSNDSLWQVCLKAYPINEITKSMAERLQENVGVYEELNSLVSERSKNANADVVRENIIKQLSENKMDYELLNVVSEVRQKLAKKEISDNHPEYWERDNKQAEVIEHLEIAFEHLEFWTQPLIVSLGKDNLNNVDIVEESVPHDSTGAPMQRVQKKSDVGIEKSSLTLAKIILNSMSQFIFPLLFGLMGAYLFVLRSVLSSIKSLTFVSGDQIGYRVRLVLGALSGLAIGFFFGETDSGKPFSISNLSPLTLAFLAGYSVDLLFNMMDSLIKRLGNVQSQIGDKAAS